ncbi:MAG: LpxL/LpxP family Kdo(2)-lipid IV(A) lauroyl/palmitoleoyl acyltransferase [Haliea sp.]|nr:LpxL/LpxP family Kdo(2)-lipid IV(A) lauroyl/palmitoleoyl acyltransferase [Haliea sp.]MDP5064683.1 LpxL/LpxP family Kdo(2)-lipid IV(A) lauroyl/palmitoleoyl acyltransferase [Haliea sp.]
MSAPRQRTRDTRYGRYLHPRWWPTWLLIGFMWLLSRFPLRAQWWLGTGVGELAYRLLRRRRHIAEVNIRLCFPELNDAEQNSLVRRAFHSNGIGILEIGLAWFRNPDSFLPYTRVHGLENLERALANGNGVLALGGHYSSIDLCGTLATRFIEADVMQRDHNNALLNAVMTRAREHHYGVALSAKDLRGLLRQLRAGRTVWYATDQDYGRKGTVFTPFFGVDAASITATSRIAERSGCSVLAFSHFRRSDSLGYDLYFHPALEHFPSGDDQADAMRINAIIEHEVRRHPEQYLWMHRRFKTRPGPQDPSPYLNGN